MLWPWHDNSSCHASISQLSRVLNDGAEAGQMGPLRAFRPLPPRGRFERRGETRVGVKPTMLMEDRHDLDPKRSLGMEVVRSLVGPGTALW